MRNHLLLAASLGLALAACNTNGASKVDTAFITDAIAADEATASLGALASMVGDSEAVRTFGAKLTADHTQARAAAVSVANAMGTKPSVTADADAEFTALQALNGKAFDDAFVSYITNEYTEMAAATAAQAGSETPRIALLAKARLPVIRGNLEAVRELSGAPPERAAS